MRCVAAGQGVRWWLEPALTDRGGCRGRTGEHVAVPGARAESGEHGHHSRVGATGRAGVDGAQPRPDCKPAEPRRTSRYGGKADRRSRGETPAKTLEAYNEGIVRASTASLPRARGGAAGHREKRAARPREAARTAEERERPAAAAGAARWLFCRTVESRRRRDGVGLANDGVGESRALGSSGRYSLRNGEGSGGRREGA